MQAGNKIILLFLLCVFILSSVGYSQIEDNLKRYTGKNGEGYISPLVNGLSVNINRGWYQTAKLPVLGLRFRIGTVAMIAPIPDKDKKFMATPEAPFQPKTPVEASTIVGSEESVTVTGDGGTVYPFPGGLNMNVTAFAAPQVSIGFLGSEAIVRYFSIEMGDSEAGKLSVFGLGVRHSISQYLILFPVDITIGAFWQKIDVDKDLININTLHYGVQASRGFGPLTVFGGIGFDNSNASVSYTYEDEDTTKPIELDIKGDNGIEITSGLGLNMAIIHLSAEAAFGTRTAFAVNLSFGL
ncbi:hypothetical protein JXQ31_18160 [candidate division KSB1 bacterium]|nr:hypothetical protein [candidate division KSB1 bacterium]